MNLQFNPAIADGYKSPSQKARVLTENWMTDNMYCPHCGNENIKHFPNNTPVADFFCPVCGCRYELKSKSGTFGNKIVDGVYDTMIQRITSNQNPDFFLLNYSKKEAAVQNLVFVPKHFFVPAIIEKRNPLRPTARRAGWTGCNINIGGIPKQGVIYIVDKGKIVPSQAVVKQVKRSMLLETSNIDARGWIFDILNCVNAIPVTEFTLNEVYAFEETLHKKHPDNNNIKPKIRQQLQELRDRGFIEFLGKGLYRKVL